MVRLMKGENIQDFNENLDSEKPAIKLLSNSINYQNSHIVCIQCSLFK